MKTYHHITLLAFCLILFSCNQSKVSEFKIFELLDPKETGIDFRNDLSFEKDFNIYTYRNFYNGGGVGIGDFDNDGLADIYFTGNMKKNQLYRNLGDLKFENISETAGIRGNRAWSTGVSVVDINADGFLDIYVCNSGDVEGDNKQNELFINNGDLTFTERAVEYGLDDGGYSTHAAFFDYDKDGDLDMYLLNNSYQAIGSFNLKKNVREKRDVTGGDKLFRNDNGQFINVSEEAGIYGSIIGFGLGVTVGDVNKDGWEDIYVSNDFFERDYLYMNNRDGTFKEDLTNQINSISGASMGADMADINNDGLQDIFVTEMLPRDNARLKTKTTFENWDKYTYNVSNGYYHQFTRNMLHQNFNGSKFQEVGRLKDVHATDWSWGALMADFNSDGFRDIFVANGIYQDLTDQDYLNYIGNEETMSQMIGKDGVDYNKLIEVIPSNPIPNYIFENQGRENSYNFVESNEKWGLSQETFSNGAAYVDLDNDGDLELVINNVNMPSMVYRNHSIEQKKSNYIQFELRETGLNKFAIGATVEVFAEESYIFQEHVPIRGFESSMDYKMTIGLGTVNQIDSVLITWSDLTYTKLYTPEINSLHSVLKNDASSIADNNTPELNTLFQELPLKELSHRHIENEFVDFDRNKLLYHMRSALGPCMCQGDLTGDGLSDIYIGGSKDMPGIIYVQNMDKSFAQLLEFAEDKISEDTDCVIFDANNDGRNDLYVASGGFEFPNTSTALLDRLYFNNGNNSFTKSKQLLPAAKYESTSSIDVADYDKDGDVDLVVGIGFKPFQYGLPVGLYILENDGKGEFKNVTQTMNSDLSALGILTDVSFADLNQDEYQDIVVVGEWMAPEIFIYEETSNTYSRQTETFGLSNTKGWWKSVEVLDVNKDGRNDIIVGNLGLNTSFKASNDKPIRLYINDFDKNGSVDHIYAQQRDEMFYPMALMHDLIGQLPGLRKKFVAYKDYSTQSMSDIFTQEELDESLVLEANQLGHMVFYNEGEKKWKQEALAYGTQVAPIFDFIPAQMSNGERLLISGGNLNYVKPEVGRYDAGFGNVLNMTRDGIREIKNSGLLLDGDIRKFLTISREDDQLLIVGRNNNTVQLFSYEK